MEATGRAVQYTGTKLDEAGARDVARRTLEVTERVFDSTEKAVGVSLEYTKKAIDVTVVGTKKAVEVAGKTARTPKRTRSHGAGRAAALRAERRGAQRAAGCLEAEPLRRG